MVSGANVEAGKCSPLYLSGTVPARRRERWEFANVQFTPTQAAASPGSAQRAAEEQDVADQKAKTLWRDVKRARGSDVHREELRWAVPPYNGAPFAPEAVPWC